LSGNTNVKGEKILNSIVGLLELFTFSLKNLFCGKGLFKIHFIKKRVKERWSSYFKKVTNYDGVVHDNLDAKQDLLNQEGLMTIVKQKIIRLQVLLVW